MAVLNVSAIIVTRGDVDLAPIRESLPAEWERVVWNNTAKTCVVTQRGSHHTVYEVTDLSVYGRYAAIEYASNDLVYVQDDDCVVSDPQRLMDKWLEAGKYPFDGRGSPWGSDPRDYVDHVVCNMPQEFRHDFYTDHALVGFGACFHRSAPARAWGVLTAKHGDAGFPTNWAYGDFLRTCDVAFTGLTPRVLVDVPYENLPWASAENRMWKQPTHVEERTRMLELVRKVRDAG